MIAKRTSRRRRPDGNDFLVEIPIFSMACIGKEHEVALNCPKAGILRRLALESPQDVKLQFLTGPDLAFPPLAKEKDKMAFLAAIKGLREKDKAKEKASETVCGHRFKGKMVRV